jgi:hypothetical protein
MNRAFRDHADVPVRRIYLWNVAAVLVAAADLYAARHWGVLGWVLGIVTGVVVAGGVAIALIERRCGVSLSSMPDEVAQEHERVAASIAAMRSMREAA